MRQLKQFALPGIAACALVAMLALAGCSAAAAGGTMTIGEQADSAMQVAVSNETGKDIEGFYFKKSKEKKYGAALAQSGLLTAGATATLNVPNPDKAALDMRFVTNDGAKYQIKSLDVADVQDAALKLSAAGESCYIEYTSAKTGKAMSILESEQIAAEKAAAEKKAKEEAEKAKKEAEEAKKKAEEAAKADEQAAATQETSSGSGTSSYSESSYSGSSSSGGSSGSGSSSSSTKSSSSSSKSSSSSSKSSSGSSSSGSSSKSGSSSSGSGSSGSGSGSSGSGSGSSGSGSSGSDSSGGGEDNRCIEL